MAALWLFGGGRTGRCEGSCCFEEPCIFYLALLGMSEALQFGVQRGCCRGKVKRQPCEGALEGWDLTLT